MLIYNNILLYNVNILNLKKLESKRRIGVLLTGFGKGDYETAIPETNNPSAIR